jgi:hypothetical protein
MGRVSPQLHPPRHFARYCEKIETSIGADLRLVFSAPPQHGKTECTLHGLVWLVLNHPGKRHAYITYSQQRADSVSRKVRRILADAGVKCEGTLDMLRLPNGGQILFRSIDGGITGEPVDGLAIIDDPFKNRREADSALRREQVLECYREAIETRVHPGASILVLATRWHPQDLSGTLIDEGWECINLPAFAEEHDPNGREVGEALFPEMWSVEALEKKRRKVLEFTWQALYQGHPRPKGGTVFEGAHYYTQLPTNFRGGYGVDLAYTAKARSDWSICLGLIVDEDSNPEFPDMYLVKLDRAQVKAPEFALTLKSRHRQRQHWPMLWRCSGTEKGVADFMTERGIPLETENPPGDKLVSSEEAAAAWNDGRIKVPDPDAFRDESGSLMQGWEWLEDNLDAFLDIVQNFTGSGKEHDDDVDALGNAVKVTNGEMDLSTAMRLRMLNNRRPPSGPKDLQ